jgi:hypothetical protein
VATFAQEFWSLRPDARRGRWQNLLGRVATDPQLTARLRRLEAGVDLRDATGIPGPPRQRQLIGMIQTLFVLGPIERAARRRELLGDLPGYSTLEPALLERLGAWTRRLAVPAAEIARPAATWGFQAQGGFHIPQAPRLAVRPPRRSPRWTVFWLIGIVLLAVRGYTGGFQGSDSPNPGVRSPLSRPDAPLGLPPAPPTPAYRPLSPEAKRILDKHTPSPTRHERRP